MGNPEKKDWIKENIGEIKVNVDYITLQRMTADYLIQQRNIRVPFDKVQHPGIGKAHNAFKDFILTGEIDKSLSSQEHLLVAMEIGQNGNLTYSEDRANDARTTKTISIEEFREQQKTVITLRNTYEQHKSWGETTDEIRHSYILAQYADILGVTKEELTAFYEEKGEKIDKKFIDAAISKFLAQGICRDIATFQYQYLKAAGFKDAFISSTSYFGRIHSLVGGKLQDGSFFFINGGNFLPVGKHSLKAALAELEKALGAASLGYVLQTEKGIFYTRTRASQDIENAVVPIAQREDNNGMAQQGLTLQIQNEAAEVEWVKEVFKGGNIILNSRLLRPVVLEDHSIDAATSASISFEGGINEINAGANLGISKEKYKMVYRDMQMQITQALSRVFVEANPTIKITPEIELKLAVIAEAIAALTLNHNIFPDSPLTLRSFGSFLGRVGAGAEISFLLTPDISLKLLASSDHYVVPKKIQDSSVRLENYQFSSENITTGASATIQVPNNLSSRDIILLPSINYAALQLDEEGSPQGHQVTAGINAIFPSSADSAITATGNYQQTFSNSFVVDKAQNFNAGLGYQTQVDKLGVDINAIGFCQKIQGGEKDQTNICGMNFQLNLNY